MLTESGKKIAQAVWQQDVLAGDYLLKTVKQDQTIRIHDLYGNQAADTRHRFAIKI
jgi:uncharacterized protein YcgI (DUF1989 family)